MVSETAPSVSDGSGFAGNLETLDALQLGGFGTAGVIEIPSKLEVQPEGGRLAKVLGEPESTRGRSVSPDSGTIVFLGGTQMARTTLLDRITANPEIFGGKPIVRGMRISVELILSLLSQGVPEEEILADYPELEPDDIRACIAYAHAVIANDSLEAVQVAVR